MTIKLIVCRIDFTIVSMSLNEIRPYALKLY